MRLFGASNSQSYGFIQLLRLPLEVEHLERPGITLMMWPNSIRQFKINHQTAQMFLKL